MMVILLFVSAIAMVTVGGANIPPRVSVQVEDLFSCHCIQYDIYCDDIAEEPYYEKASKFCTDRGDSLAIVKSEYSNAAIAQAIGSINDPSCTLKSGYFIGLSDTRTEGSFEWYDGTYTCPVRYSNWLENQPDNNPRRGDHGQDCVQMWFKAGKSNGEWDDDYCNRRPKGVICQKVHVPCTD